MSDDLSQAGLIDQPIDETAEVPVQTTEEVSAETEQPKEPTYTLDQVRQLIREEVNPLIQSQVAKSENRTNQKIQERLVALEMNRGTLKLSEADYEAAQNEIIREEQMKAFKPQSPTGSETQQPAPALNTERFVSSQIDMVFADVGVRVTPEDAEFKVIEQAWNDPKGSLAKTLIAANQAATAKATRLNALKENAPARSGVSGGRTSGNTVYDPNKPASFYLEQAAQDPKKK